jgi:hypothetical protein
VVISGCILRVLNLTEREVRQENASSFKDEQEKDCVLLQNASAFFDFTLYPPVYLNGSAPGGHGKRALTEM